MGSIAVDLIDSTHPSHLFQDECQSIKQCQLKQHQYVDRREKSREARDKLVQD